MSKKKLSYEDYGKTVKKLKEEYRRKNEAIEKEFVKQKGLIASFSMGDKIPINFDTMDSLFKMDVWENINEKVLVKKVFTSPDVIKFETTIEKGGLFGWHCHGDCIEVCEVVEGKLFDSVRNKTHLKGDFVIYTPMEYHTPGALVYTKLLVTFNRI